MAPLHSSKAGIETLRDTSIDNSAQACKSARGHLYGYHIQNPNAADAWFQLYDAATTAVTVSATTPKLSLVVPASGAIEQFLTDDNAIRFSTAITYAATKTSAASASGPTTALVGNLFYR